MNNDDLLLDVLRAAGHGDAAELASKVLAHGQPPAAPVAPAPPPSRAATGFGNDTDAAREEGLMILNAMRQAGILPAAEPIDGEAA